MPLINVDQKGITSIINNKRITFEFITDPHTRMISEVKDILLKKEKQICFLKEEVDLLNITSQLKKPEIQNQIKLIDQQFRDEICNDLPNAFWDRKKHVISLPYLMTLMKVRFPLKLGLLK